ncbi:MAG: DUF4340 domain-containing protein [Bacteroidales bacterium]|nr:DUF4340 domain-containing protein [Bacteroidales bacterium]
MKRNKLLIIITAVLAILATVFFINNTDGTLNSADNDFAIADTALITKVFLADKSDNAVLLERRKEGWIVNGDYFAEPKMIKSLMKAMSGLAVKYPVGEAAQDNVIRLLGARSTKVEVYQIVYKIDLFNTIKLFPEERATKIYYVGNPTQDNVGTYMYMENGSIPYVVYLPGFRGYVSARFSTYLKEWRVKNIFSSKISDIKSVSVDFPKETQKSFKVNNQDTRNLELISLGNNNKVEQFDTLKVVEFLANFRDLNYEMLITGTKPDLEDSIRNAQPDLIITLEHTDGYKQVLKKFNKIVNPDLVENELMDYYDRERFYALIEDDKDLVVTQYFAFDPVLRPIDFYLK